MGAGFDFGRGKWECLDRAARGRRRYGSNKSNIQCGGTKGVTPPIAANRQLFSRIASRIAGGSRFSQLSGRPDVVPL
jgi:hypothetical protein